MMKDLQCPYCEKEIEICHDDGHGMDEDRKHQDQCPWCGKNFIFTTSIIVSHYTEQADCLNGGNHDYKKTAWLPAKYSRLVCSICGDTKRITTDGEK